MDPRDMHILSFYREPRSKGESMNLGQIKSLCQDVAAFAKDNAPQLLLATGTIGVGVTTVLGIRAGMRIQQIHNRLEENGIDEEDLVNNGNVAGLVKTYAPAFIPPIIAGVATVGAYVGAFTLQNNRIKGATATAVSAMALAAKYENILEDIKEKPKAKLAAAVKKADDDVEEEATEAIMSVGPEHVEGSGDAIFYDVVTGKVFWSSKSKLEQARAEVLRKITDSVTGSANIMDFYDGLGFTTSWEFAGYFGWDHDCPFDIRYSAKYSSELDVPIGVISYKYKLLDPTDIMPYY